MHVVRDGNSLLMIIMINFIMVIMMTFVLVIKFIDEGDNLMMINFVLDWLIEEDAGNGCWSDWHEKEKQVLLVIGKSNSDE